MTTFGGIDVFGEIILYNVFMTTMPQRNQSCTSEAKSSDYLLRPKGAATQFFVRVIHAYWTR